MRKANEIYMIAVKTENNEKAIIDITDFSYLVRMTNALEQINEVQQRVYDGEIDGFDFGEQVEEILQRT